MGRRRAAVLDALADQAWRVREMALRVVARHRLEDATAAALTACDPVLRVRLAAERAVVRLASNGHERASG